jgi:hypothetical protein
LKQEVVMKKLISFVLGILLLQSPTLLFAAKVDKPTLELTAKFNPSLSSEYFGFVGFDIENNTRDWQHVVSVDLVFSNPVHDDITKIVSGKQLQAWGEATTHRQAVRDFWWNVALGGIATLGSIAVTSHDADVRAAGAVAGIGSITSLGVRELSKRTSEINFAAILPETHLLAGDFHVPPRMTVQKWVLFYTRHDETTPMLRKAKVVLTTDDQKTHEFDVALMPLTQQPWQSIIWDKMLDDASRK